MSSYWGATTGMALHLNQQETEAFFGEYLRKTCKPNATDNDVAAFNEMLEDICHELTFVSSKNRMETMDKLPALKAVTESLDSDVYSDMYDEIAAQIEEVSKQNVFSIEPYDDDPYSGGYMQLTTKHTHKMHNNRTNNDIEYEEYDDREIEDGILIYTQKSVLPQSILTGNSYKSLEEIFDEFKYRLRDYLPEDFDWKAHIGFFQCAVYA